MFRDFCKIDSESSLESLIVIRVKSFGKKRDSCQVESPSVVNVTQVEWLTWVHVISVYFHF